MARTPGDGLGWLRSTMTGPVLGPHDDGYDDTRKVWNADIDCHPAVIAQCRDAADVAAALAFAAEHALEIAVRGGAHSSAGVSTVDDGMIIHLGRLNHVAVDPVTKRARVGGGALLGDLDAATQAHGLAVPAGLISHTGVAGLTLGGGMGWLTRQAGLSIDNLESAEIVTADGRILRVAADENPDLFWAIRGGGGNFGVVTEFEFRLHEVGPIIQFGFLFWDLDQGTEVLRLAREIVGHLPRDLNIVIAGINAPPAPFVPAQYHLRPGYALLVTGFGAPQTHEEVVTQIRSALPPLFEFITPMPYVELQRLLDEANAWGFHSYDKSCNLGGRRIAQFAVFIVAVCPTPEVLAADRAWARSLWTALRPHSLGIGGYVNAMSEFEDDRVRAAYGPGKYARLAAVKREFDPYNVFHRNANIEPATIPG